MEDPTKIKVGVLLLVLSSLLWMNCSGDSAKQTQKFEKGFWLADEVVEFPFEVADTAARYTIEWDFVHDVRYPHSNLFIFARFSDEQNPEQIDTLEYQVAYTDGVFLGAGNQEKTLRMVYAEDVQFKKTGKHSISVQHGMRRDSLLGVHELRFYVTKSDN